MIGYIRISSVEYERDNTKLKSAHITNFHVQVYHNHLTFDLMVQPKFQSAPTRLQRECEDYDYEHDTVGGVHIRASFQAILSKPGPGLTQTTFILHHTGVCPLSACTSPQLL